MRDADRHLLRRAEGYLELNLPAAALDCLQRVSESIRDDYEWQSLMGECYRELKDYIQAIPFFEAALAQQPWSMPSAVALGWCLKRADRLPDAIAVLLAAEKHCKRLLMHEYHGLVMYNLSCYYSLAKAKREMLHWLTQALSLNPQCVTSIEKEPDFDPFRDDVDFKRVVASATLAVAIKAE